MTHLTLNTNQQKGAVLMVGLIIIVVLTMIGVSAISTSVMGEKMSGNQRDREISFQAAEGALKDGEQWIMGLQVIPKAISSCDNKPCDLFTANSFTNLQSQDLSWWQTNARAFSSNIEGAKSQPNYIIQEHTFAPYDLSPESRSKGLGYHYYQVTAKGTGGSDEAQSTVQSIYATQFN